MVLEDERTSIFDRIEIRKRLALECPELLSDAELSKLEESMLRSVQVARQVRRDDYERRARAAGVPTHWPNQGDIAAYGDLQALVRREVRQLELARRLGRMDKPGLWTREDKLKLAALAVSSLLLLLGLLTNVVGVEHVWTLVCSRWSLLDRRTPRIVIIFWRRVLIPEAERWTSLSEPINRRLPTNVVPTPGQRGDICNEKALRGQSV